jgi:type III pantothenate kinase
MLLALDIGNSIISLGVFSHDTLVDHWRISSDLKKTEDEYALIIRDLFSLKGLESSEVNGAIIESVVPQLLQVLQKSIQRLFHLDALIFSSQTPMGIENRYENPQEVGMDRLANAVGGINALGAPVIIVDFGTAITLDLVDKDRAYAGGVILPGMEISAEALFKRTSKLPRVSLLPPPNALGKTTITSIQSGLFWGTLGSVESLIRRLWKEIGYETKVIVTGGGAAELIHEMPYVDLFDPHLTLRGLQSIWSHNRKRKA